MKKTLSLLTIVAIFAVFGGMISFVRANYIEPAGSPVGNNTPAPIITADVSGNSPQIKLGKLGITSDSSIAIDTTELANQSTVVMGQIGTEGLVVAGIGRIRANVDASSTNYPLFVGDPTSSSFMQVDGSNNPRLFKVTGHTRAPRIVVGSKTFSPQFYNLTVAPGTKTNLGQGQYSTTWHYCTITANQLRDYGCPNGTYNGTYYNTYLAQSFPGSGADVVGICRYLVPSGTGPYNTNNAGACPN